MHIFIQFTFLLINLIYMHDLVIIIIKMCPSMCYYSNGGFSSYTAPIGMKYPRDYKCLHNFCTTQIMMMYSTYIRSFLAKYFSSTYYTGGLIHSRDHRSSNYKKMVEFDCNNILIMCVERKYVSFTNLLHDHN